MTTPISTFASINYISKNIITYLEEIKYNAEILSCLKENTDTSGTSIDWQKINGNWKNVSIGIHNIFNELNAKKFGIFNQMNPYQFDFSITYYTRFQTIKSIIVANIDFKYLCDKSPDCVFGTDGGGSITDFTRINRLNEFLLRLNEIIAVFMTLG